MSQTNPVALGRKEADRFNRGGRLRVLLRRPEVGAFFVMVAVVAAIAIASNVALNPLGLKTTSRSSRSSASSPPGRAFS
jgi:simple sugar transport system permease protein